MGGGSGGGVGSDALLGHSHVMLEYDNFVWWLSSDFKYKVIAAVLHAVTPTVEISAEWHEIMYDDSLTLLFKI